MSYFTDWSTPDLSLTLLAYNELLLSPICTKMTFDCPSEKKQSLAIKSRILEIIQAINHELAKRTDP